MKTALIAGTNKKETALVSEILGELGFERLRECTNGQMALDSALSDLPDIAVLDAFISGIDGISVAKNILKHMPIPIIIIGSSDSLQIAKQAVESGIAAFLSRPLRNLELMSAVEISLSWLHERMALHEKIEHLSDVVETRKAVDRAKRLLMEREHLSEPDAYRKLQRTAMNRRISLRVFANEVIRTYQ